MLNTEQLTSPAAGNEVRLSAETRRNFAVIIPALNEVDNVPDLVREFDVLFKKYDLSGDIVLVDDGSTDGTPDRARQLGGRHWKVVSHRRNFGKTEAMLTGAANTDAELLVLYDADLQHSPEEVVRYLAKLEEGWDIVTGRKVGRYEKKGVSGIYNRLNRWLFKVPVSDLNSMKGFRREILEEISLRHDWHRFFVVLAYAEGFSVTELDITLHPRRHGVAKYSGRSRILVGFLDLVSVGFFLLFSRKPMILFGMTGLILAGLGILVGLLAFVMRMFHLYSPFGYRPFLTLVLMLEVLGFLCVGFGFVAELVAQQQAELDYLKRELRKRT
ncbi:MAG TPA: glycosyltransferase [Longimicrobiales bacterium]|nr:glycosyltransferase [Longimicrobiales bacterium]